MQPTVGHIYVESTEPEGNSRTHSLFCLTQPETTYEA